jgi:hypothetical protein
LPLVDPNVIGSDVQNANSASSLATPLNAAGLTVAALSAQEGFTNQTGQDQGGALQDFSGGAANAGAGAGANAGANNGAQADAGAQASAQCPGGAAQADAEDDNANDNANDNADDNAADNAGAVQVGANEIAAVDVDVIYGKCRPTMDFVLGRPNRKADEGTFLPTDDLVAEGQQDALNPNIITKRICDQLTNVCEAEQAGKDQCQIALDIVSGLGTKDATTADAFNAALGFAQP